IDTTKPFDTGDPGGYRDPEWHSYHGYFAWGREEGAAQAVLCPTLPGTIGTQGRRAIEHGYPAQPPTHRLRCLPVTDRTSLSAPAERGRMPGRGRFLRGGRREPRRFTHHPVRCGRRCLGRLRR